MEINISEVNNNSIKHSNITSNKVPVNNIIKDIAAAIKTNNNNIRGVTSNAMLYTNNNLIINNRINNKYIAGITIILYITAITISRIRGTRHGIITIWTAIT
jgi:hypothetical protein